MEAPDRGMEHSRGAMTEMIVRPVPLRPWRPVERFCEPLSGGIGHCRFPTSDDGCGREVSLHCSWKWQFNPNFKSFELFSPQTEIPRTQIPRTASIVQVHRTTDLCQIPLYQNASPVLPSFSKTEFTEAVSIESHDHQEVSKSKRIRKRSDDITNLYFVGTVAPDGASFSSIRIWANGKGSKFYDCKCGSRKAIQDLKKLKQHVSLHCKVYGLSKEKVASK